MEHTSDSRARPDVWVGLMEVGGCASEIANKMYDETGSNTNRTHGDVFVCDVKTVCPFHTFNACSISGTE